MVSKDSPQVARAKAILRQRAPVATLDAVKDVRTLAGELKDMEMFSYAWRILARARAARPEAMPADEKERRKLRTKLRQQQALCTSKDAELPADSRNDRAIKILEEEEELHTTTDQETLGIAGGIYKRKWGLDQQKQNLERSLAYYLRGYQQGVKSDYGYTAINAAFVLDLLASQEEAEARAANITSENAWERRALSKKIRLDILATLPALESEPKESWLTEEWWFYATLVEACFGLEQFDEARPWMAKAIRIEKVARWQWESTARQLASLAQVMEGGPIPPDKFVESAAGRALVEFFGGNVAMAWSASVGKVGLALSGGGFRASLFHIGVLAKLAELDVLRHVEVLSCVSGGSIIGAHYYLEIRKLLQAKPDGIITREDYIKIVQNICRDFLAGLQRNIRTRVAAEFWTNVKMLFWPHYSRTLRAGELYESEIYSRVQDSKGFTYRFVNHLLVQPLDAKVDGEGTFAPKYDNWRRLNKVPILILNATTLNTGHNWQFTASWMGEPPSGIDSEADANETLRRMYYWEAPPARQNMRLGHAVAASACVPGLFEPLALAGLYEDRTVRLVDGGVHDNQGVAGLLEQDCTVLLVSDASGQMETERNPSSGILGVPLRSNSILQARVRETQYEKLSARRRGSLLQALMFVHLKKDLDVEPVNWINCDLPYDPGEFSGRAPEQQRATSYGIRKDVQELLAGIRTDLDSFTEVEAYALMTSGYCMTEKEFEGPMKNFPHWTGPRANWPFLAIERLMKQDEEPKRLIRQLNVASQRAFKVWRLLRELQIAATLVGLIGLCLAVCFYRIWWPFVILTVTGGFIATAVLAWYGGRLFGAATMKVLRYRKTLSEIAIGIGMCAIGWIFARLHLHFFDKLYLWQGQVKRVLGQT